MNENGENFDINHEETIKLEADIDIIDEFRATLDEIEKHALRFSKMYQYDKKNNKKSSKWSDKDARPKMALKTVLKGLLGTYGVITTDLARAFENDNEHESSDSYRNVEEAEIIEQKETKDTKKVQI